MKKRTLLIFLLAAVSTLTVASAGVISGCANPDDDTEQTQTTTYTVTFNSNGGSAVEAKTVKDGEKVTKPANPTNTDTTKTFGGWYTDAACTQAFDFNTPITANITLYAKWNTQSQAVTEYTVTFNSMGGSAVDPATVEEGDAVARPADPTNTDTTKTFGGWYTDEACTQAYDFSTPVTGNITLYAKWNTQSEVEYENVTTVLGAAAVAAAPVGSDGKFAVDTTIGKFTFGQGTKPEDAGATINTQGKDITIVLGGKTNSISFTAEGASTKGDTEITLISVGTDGSETVVKALGSVANKVSGNFAYGKGEGESMPAGTYIIRTSISARVTNLTVVEELAKSEATGITVSGAATKFLSGRSFETTGLNVTLNYANGRKDAITSGYQVDSSAVNMSTSGKYTVTVSYTPDGATTPFTTNYEVVVYAVDSLELSDYSLGTGRITLPVQKLFKVGDTFNSDNLAVQAVCTATGVEGEEVFILNSTEYSVSSADTATAGAKTVTVSASGKSATYTVNVVDLSAASKTTVKVDAAGTVGVTDGVLTVKTINDAIQAFKLMGTADGLTKTINVAAGTYEEKVEIDIPNVRLIGAGAATTTIVFDALAGLLDPSGSMVYSTDGSATVSIRESAEGFYAEGITFKNYYNTNALYQESLTLVEKDTQAVACLVQADKSYFKNCNFTSYHDTLYAMTGRQVYENCNIEGRTDYIFGYNATCYFTGCTLTTIGADDPKNGGYIVATKGIDNGGDDVKYGYIFDNCTLTADEHVTAGTVSLARGWDVYMTVAFIECNISDAYSLEAYGNTESVKNDRYTKMNAAPDATKLFEYGNTGAGALTDEILATADATTGVIANMCTVMNDAQATEYTTLATIFGATNGNMTYADAWDGTPVQVATITIKLADDTVVGTAYGYVGGKITVSELKAAVDDTELGGKVIEGFATTAGGTAVDVSTLTLTAETTLYAVLGDAGSATVDPVTISFTGAVISTNATTSTPVVFDPTNNKTPKISGDYYIFDSTGTKTLVSIGGSQQWKQGSDYIQGDGKDRELKIDLTGAEYAGKSVKITVKAGGKDTTVTLGVSGDSSQTHTFANGSGSYPEETVVFNVDGGSVVTLTNTIQAVRFYSVTIEVV